MKARIFLCVASIVAAAMVLPQVTSAATLCVNKVGPQCDELFAADRLDDALAAANAVQASPDRIEIGPGTYDEAPYFANSVLDIVGAGPTETILTNEAPIDFGYVMLAGFGPPTVSDLGIRIGAGIASKGLQSAGGTVERVRIDTLPGADPSVGLDAFNATVRNVEVDLPMESPNSAASGSGTFEDSTFKGGMGLFFGGGTARRLRVVGTTAILTRTSRIENSVVESFGATSTGVSLSRFDGGEVELSHLTLVGDGSPGSVGISAVKGSGAFSQLFSKLTARNVVISGFATDLAHGGHPGPPLPCGTDCQITQETEIAHSAFRSSSTLDLGGPGSLTFGPGNLELADPRFADPATGDFRPRYDSSLVNAGDPTGLGGSSFYANESPVDFGGLQRIVDGRLEGGPDPRRDIGAHEYGRRPPNLALDASSTALLYRPVTVATASSDPDPGDVLSLRFEFDGRASNRAAHTFTTLGSKVVRAVATDPTGISVTDEARITVKAKRGRCANRRVGGPRRDVFTGSPAGDALVGRGGRDVLRGARGPDCLKGGPGRDLLVGGPGADRLDGGTGADVIKARDRKRDRVDCGPGKDRAIVDRVDRVRRCEAVQRPAAPASRSR